MEQLKCQIYRPSKGRSAKRQKVEPTRVDESLELRKLAYRLAWAEQESQFDALTHDLNQSVMHKIKLYLQQPPESSSVRVTLPAAFVVTGSIGALDDLLFNQLQAVIEEDRAFCFVSLSAADAPNLKTLLKNLIGKATTKTDSVDQDLGHDQAEEAVHKRLLNYDLEILHNWCKARDRRTVIVCFQNAEAFDAVLLTDVLTLLHSWLDRISFKLVLGIATSLQLFQQRLPKQALRCMLGRLFTTPNPEDAMEAVFQESVTAEKSTVRLGPTLVADFMQRQHDHTQSVQDFKQVLKYAYMSHFYADPVSIFLDGSIQYGQVSTNHFEAVRNLPSFRRYVELLLDGRDLEAARNLLESDEELFDVIKKQIERGRRRVIWSMGTCATIKAVRETVTSKDAVPFSALYTRSLSGTLQGSALLKEIVMSAGLCDPETLAHLVTKVIDILIIMPPSDIDVSPEDFYDVQNELQALVEQHAELRGFSDGEDTNKQSLTDKPISQKVGTQKRRQQSAALTEFSRLRKVFVERLTEYIGNALLPLESIFLNEILFYDLRSPHRDAFTPRPRIAVERALSAPKDYLGCECCTQSLSGTRPTTAILYQLYLDSGALINALDLWTAFRATIAEQYPNEQTAMALFFRSLAELRHLGMIKQSRKRTDCLAKMTWKGL